MLVPEPSGLGRVRLLGGSEGLDPPPGRGAEEHVQGWEQQRELS